MSATQLTKEKFEELSRELETLTTVRRKEIAENLEYAKSLGDLSENAEYHEARTAQAELEARITNLERTLRDAQIVQSGARDKSVATVGATVRVRRAKDGTELTYALVGSEEGDAAAGRISIDSPLGRAVSGKRAGEGFSVKTPNGGMDYSIVSIS